MSRSREEKFHEYPDTILEFARPREAPLRVDLRRRLDTATQDAIAALGLGGCFAIFTAENPEGAHAEDAPGEAARQARDEANARRERALEDALREVALPWRRVDGMAPDGAYREHCVAVAIPRDDAAPLAARLGQLALFWYDGDRFWLLPAAASERPLALPPSPGRPVSPADPGTEGRRP